MTIFVLTTPVPSLLVMRLTSTTSGDSRSALIWSMVTLGATLMVPLGPMDEELGRWPVIECGLVTRTVRPFSSDICSSAVAC